MFRDIELDSEGDVTTSTQSQSVRKNISLKLKGKGRGRGRGKSTRLKKPELGKADLEDTGDTDTADIRKTPFNIEEDISKLEAPTFTTIDRGPPEPLHRNAKLKWDHKVNLIGEKVVNPMIHCCEKCQLPILIYGRMIACKHVFCLDCAKKADKVCPRCNDKVQRVEQTGLGTVFMCTYGGSRHGNNGCRRTYLSQRDLQAHINHRHLKTPGQHHENAQPGQPPIGHHVAPPTQPQPSAGSHHHHEYENRDPREMRGVHEAPRSATAHHHPVDLHSHHMPVIHPPHQHPMQHVAAPHDNVILPPPPDPLRPSYHREDVHQQPHISSRPHLPYSQPPPGPAPPAQPPPAHGYASPIPVMSTRTNLITVPIQDDPSPDYHQSPHQNPFHPPSQSHHHQPPPPQQSGGVAYPQQHPVPPPPPYTHPPPAHHPVPANFAPPVSQPPVAFTAPISTPTFTQPPPSHFPPPLHSHPPPTVTGATNNPPPLYTTPPPGHHPPPLSHSGPPPNHPPFNAPQRFTPPAQPPQFEDSHLSSPPYNPVGPHNAWNPSQPRGPPPIRPSNNPNMGPPQPRPPYYHQ